MGAVAEVSLTFSSKDVLSSLLHGVCEIWRAQVLAEIHFRVLGETAGAPGWLEKSDGLGDLSLLLL